MRSYTTFNLGTVLPNIGPRAEKLRRAETTSGGSLGPLRKKRSVCGPRAEIRCTIVPRAFGYMTDHERGGSWRLWG